MATGKRPRPASTRDVGDRLKLHRRLLRLDGADYTVVMLRPGTQARFATNNFHETWHILSDQHGAQLLARLLWGLSYQRRPGTLVLIDLPQLDPNPFDAEPSDPIALVPARLTPFRVDAARALRRQLPLRTPPTGTVRWLTAGLDRAVADYQTQCAAWTSGGAWRYQPLADPAGAQVGRHGRMLVCAATATLLRLWALRVALLGEYWYGGMDYTYLDAPYVGTVVGGEVQVFRDYRRRAAVARRARAEVLAAHKGGEPPDPTELAPVVWARGTQIRARR